MARGKRAIGLPKAVRERVHEIRSRLRRNAFWKGLFATLSVAVVALLVLAVVDASFVLVPTGVRFAIWGMGVLGVTSIFIIKLVIPVTRKWSEVELTRLLEERLPELEERLSTVVSLKGREGKGKSDPLLSALTGIAVNDAKSVKPKREFKLKGVGVTAGVVAGGVVLAGLGFALAPELAGRILARAGNPLSKSANAFAGGLTVKPGDVTIAEGEGLTIELEVPEGADARVEFLRWEDSGPQTMERMMRSSSLSAKGRPLYRMAFPSVSRPFSYRIRQGRGLTARHQVRLIARPRVEQVSVRYRFPDYTGLPVETAHGSDVAIRAVRGARVEVSATLSRPVKDATLFINETPVWAHSRAGDMEHPVLTWKVVLAEGMTGNWRLELSDAQGIRNEPVRREIEVLADKIPEVVLVSPSEPELEARPDEVISFVFKAEDDLGLDSAWLVVRNNNKEVVKEERVSDMVQNVREWEGSADLSLAEIASEGVSEISVVVRVDDLRTGEHGGAQRAESGAVKIRLSGGAESLLAQTLAAQRERFARELWAALDLLVEAEKSASPLPAAFIANEETKGGVLKEIGNQCTEAESQIMGTGEAMASTIFSKQGEVLASIAQGDVATARRSASMASLSDRSRGKAHQSRKAVRSLEIAISRLQQVLREFQQESARAGLVAKLEELTAQQEELSGLMSDPRNTSILPELQEAQAAIAIEIGDMLARGSQSAAEQMAEAGKEAAKLAEKAAELAQMQSETASMMEDAIDPALRDQVTVDMLVMLEREQRELSVSSSWMAGSVPRYAKEFLFASENGETAADYLTRNLVEDASRAALANVVIFEELVSRDNAPMGSDLAHLFRWQESLARQMEALAGGDVELALQTLQEQLAAQAGELMAMSESLQPVAMELAAMEATRGIGGGLDELRRATAAAMTAGSQLGGTASSGFMFSSSPSGLAPGSDRPQNAPPAPTLAGGGNAREVAIGRTQFRSTGALNEGDLPPDIAAMQGTFESPFSIGETAMDSLPPAINDGEISIFGGNYPPDFDPNVGMEAGGPARSGMARTTGQSSSLGAASGSAAAAGSGFGSAASSFAGAAQSLSNMQAPSSDAFVSEEVKEAFQQVMEAELPAQAALAADEATKELQKMVTAMESSPSSGGWAGLAGDIDSELASAGSASVDPEYRDLVKQYFEAMAKQSNAK